MSCAGLVSGILLIIPGRVQAGVVTAKSVEFADVSSAIGSASDGDTVAIPAGTASWTKGLYIGKAITLQGAGIGQTIILDDLALDGPLLGFTNTTLGKFYRLTGIEFRVGTRTAGFLKGCVIINGDSKTFRIDHCKFYRLKNRFIRIGGAACGVIDHCILDYTNTRGGGILILHDTWDGKRWGDGSWAVPLDWGGPNAVYIEDNDIGDDSFTGSTNTKGLIDECGGARWVFRYNTVRNMHVDSHGTGSTGRYRSTRQWEIYNNTFTCNPSTPSEVIHSRGGTGVVFNNKATGYNKFQTLHTYRYNTAFRTWGGSDGTSGWDLNDPKVYASGTAGAGSGIGPNEGGGTLVVPGAGWSPNQWVGYTIKNLDGLSNIQPATNRNVDPKRPRRSEAEGPGPFFSSIVSNTADTIIARSGSQRPNKIFAPGDRFEIRRVIQSIDMIGASTGDLLSDEKAQNQPSGFESQNQRNNRAEVGGGHGRGINPLRPGGMMRQSQPQGRDGGNFLAPRWLNQKIEPVYIWNNTKDGVANAGVAIAPDRPIKEGVHFFNNKPKPDYRPFVHPHPLVSAPAASKP